MRTFYKIFYGLFIGLLVLTGGLFLTSLIRIETGIETKIVQSGSMEPSIPVGALVFLRQSASYGVGDIVTFSENTSSAVPTTHRILGVRKEGGKEFYNTKGDANEEADPREVARSEIVGKVFLSVPFAGFVLDFARQPLGFMLLIGLPALLVIIAELSAIIYEFAHLRKRRWMPVTAQPRRRHPLHSIEYVRRFATDDIFVPVRIFNARASGISRNYAGVLSSTLAVACISFIVSLESSGGTLSYFRDTELSTGNTFSAGTWPGGESPGLSMVAEQIFTEDVTQESGDVPAETEESGENGAGEKVLSEAGEETSDDVDVVGSEARETREGREERGEREQINDITPVIIETRVSAEDNPLDNSAKVLHH